MSRLALLGVAGAAAAALVIAVHPGSGGGQPPIVVAPSSPATGGDPQALTGPSLLASPAPRQPATRASGNVITGIFGELSRDTQRAAAGQFGILQDLSRALRGWVESLLRQVGAGH